jgi:hypothetical protein
MKGRLTLELKSQAGELLAHVRADNAVMQAGGKLVASLFAGKGTPITHMGVGTSDAPDGDQFATTQLTPGTGTDALQGATDVAIPADAFTIDTDATKRVVWVRARITVPAGSATGTLREAGLLSKTASASTLYNRVVFAPIVKRASDELSMFWEVSFPYGDLQWTL